MKVPVVEKILSANDRLALENQALLDAHGVLGVNLMASPGAGKTSLIEATIDTLAGRLRLGAIDGDIATSLDADRVAARGIPAVQINTGGGCHLDANMLKSALPDLPLHDMDLLLVENVGNLVCPAEFDLGEHLRVMLLSVTEGHDKPAKYPLMFRTSNLLLLNKIDLLTYCDFDVAAATATARDLNPAQTVLQISCRTGDGLDAWIAWLEARVAELRRT